jgi:virginiamycin B lyase
MRNMWLVAAGATLFAAPPLAAQEAELDEWTVPWEQSRPRDPFVAPDGRVWFVGQRSHYAAVFDIATGEFRRFELPDGAGPHNLIVAPDGIVWYAGNRQAHIGRLDPRTGAIEQIPMPDGRPRDPHTMIFDAAGDIWFTAQGGNAVGHLDTETRAVRIIEVATARARPYGIALAPDGRVWVALFGTSKLGVVDPASFTLREIDLPREDSRPRRLGITSDGRVWYVDYVGGKLGVFNPATETFEEWDMPDGNAALPYGMAVDAEDRVWFVETGTRPNKFVGFDTRTNRFLEPIPVESGAGAIRHMFFHAATNTIWFGTDANTLGRARLDPAERATP